MNKKDNGDYSPEQTARKAVRSQQEALGIRLGEMIDLFLEESDPRKWPGDKTPADRGDRFWFKRNAEATGRIAMRAMQLLEPAIGASTVTTPEEEDERAAKRARDIERLHRDGIAILGRWEARRGKRP